jgi:hypothetical protein
MDEPRRRQVEVFSAGCAVCGEAESLVKRLAGEFDDVQVRDMQDREVADLARSLGIQSVPAVVITASRLAPCCAAGAGPDESVLREAGLGRALPTEQRKRQVEVFSAGCAMCEEVIELVKANACSSCDIQVRDVRDAETLRLARSLGIRSVPAVVITASEVASCCANRGVDEAILRREGVGQPI